MFNILFWVAVIPPLFLMWKVYQMDSVEKEPVGLLVKLFVLGAIICLPAGLIENFLEGGLKQVLDASSIPYAVISNFIIVAGAEEGLKYLVLKKSTWNHKGFDYRFDAVVYAVAVTLGFAALENILYVADGGMSVALSRALLSIPGHCIFGIYMGCYYGMAKQYDLAGRPDGARSYLRKALLQPVLLHGFYDFCLSTGYDIFIIVFFIYVIILDIRAYRAIKKMAKDDYKM